MRLRALVVIAAAAAAPVSEEMQGALEARSLERRSCGDKYIKSCEHLHTKALSKKREKCSQYFTIESYTKGADKKGRPTKVPVYRPCKAPSKVFNGNCVMDMAKPVCDTEVAHENRRKRHFDEYVKRTKPRGIAAAQRASAPRTAAALHILTTLRIVDASAACEDHVLNAAAISELRQRASAAPAFAI